MPRFKDTGKLISKDELMYMHKKFMEEIACNIDDVSGDNVEKREVVEMCLADEPFAAIKSGKKTLELRLYDDKRKSIRVGDSIVFKNRENTAEIAVFVKALYHFDSFKNLFSEPEMLAKAGWSELTASEAADIMYSYYTKEQEHEFGVLGIEFTVI